MHKTAAVLRHRELTQEIYNIGDEVAEYTCLLYTSPSPRD